MGKNARHAGAVVLDLWLGKGWRLLRFQIFAYLPFPAVGVLRFCLAHKRCIGKITQKTSTFLSLLFCVWKQTVTCRYNWQKETAPFTASLVCSWACTFKKERASQVATGSLVGSTLHCAHSRAYNYTTSSARANRRSTRTTHIKHVQHSHTHADSQHSWLHWTVRTGMWILISLLTAYEDFLIAWLLTGYVAAYGALITYGVYHLNTCLEI